ncbi:MAG: arsenate reductase ArsC [Usitatibacter sp.]
MRIHVLFLCRRNSARSIMAESMLNALGGGRFKAYSAGSEPLGRVHPLAIELLNRHGYDTAGARSKDWSEFTGPQAPRLDYVISLCDESAELACRVFGGKPVRAHWPIADPAVVQGSADSQRQAFLRALSSLRRRVQRFTGLPFESIDGQVMGSLVQEIGSDA